MKKIMFVLFVMIVIGNSWATWTLQGPIKVAQVQVTVIDGDARVRFTHVSTNDATTPWYYVESPPSSELTSIEKASLAILIAAQSTGKSVTVYSNSGYGGNGPCGSVTLVEE